MASSFDPAIVCCEVFSCPRCGAEQLRPGPSSVQCGACGGSYPAQDGLVDFLVGEPRGALDAMDYDAFYRVDAGKASQSFDMLHRHTGRLLERAHGDVLEIGAGTGQLTLGLAQHVLMRRLVVTDISKRMLAKCGARVASEMASRDIELVLATSDAANLAARSAQFSAVFGYFVIHHVVDFRRTLADVFRVTRDDGVAVFVEPGERFHRAMVLTLSRTLQRMMTSADDQPGTDLSKLLNLNNEWEYSLRHAGNTALLSKQEDKHMFPRVAFEAASREAGWAFADAIPMDADAGPAEVARVYASQLGLTPEGAARFLDRFTSELPGPFALLDRVDASPSYVFLLAKREAERADWAQLLPASVPAEITIPRPLLGYEPQYDLRVALSPEAPYVSVDGWIATTRPVRTVVVEADGVVARAGVGVRRSDVLDALASCEAIPWLNAFHSGLRALETLPEGPVPDHVASVRLFAELDDGARLLVAERLTLRRERGKRSGRIHRIGAPRR